MALLFDGYEKISGSFLGTMKKSDDGAFRPFLSQQTINITDGYVN
jgi:hypothetical protein